MFTLTFSCLTEFKETAVKAANLFTHSSTFRLQVSALYTEGAYYYLEKALSFHGHSVHASIGQFCMARR